MASSRRTALLPFLTLVAITLVVLANHFYRVHTQGLSLWKGGGMGMFTTQDAPGTRVVAATLETADATYVISGQALGRHYLRFRGMPTRANLLALCRYVAAQQWYDIGTMRSSRLDASTLISRPLAGLSGHKTARQHPLEVQSLQVQGWKVNVDLRANSVEKLPLGVARWKQDAGCSVDG